MPQLIENAWAKVNLCLHITGKRADGFHLLESLVVFPKFGDVLQVSESDCLSLTIDGPFSKGLSTSNNLVLQAANLLATNRGAAIRLTKNLPIFSGIGGGSSDAAATLRILSQYWKIALPKYTEIQKLGADVPVCMSHSSQIMRGTGEVLSPISGLPEFAILMVNSGLPVSTSEIFAALPCTDNPKMEPFDAFESFEDMVEYLKRQRNDMQTAASELAQEITSIIKTLERFPDCAMARMSGSGGTCFGLFKTLQLAKIACCEIESKHPEYWVAAAIV